MSIKRFVETGTAVSAFIKKIKNETNNGLETDWELKSPIECEVSIIIKGTVSGGADIKIINFGSKVEGEEVQKIKFSIGPKVKIDEKLEQLKRDTEIAKLSGQLEEGKRKEVEERKKKENLDGFDRKSFELV